MADGGKEGNPEFIAKRAGSAPDESSQRPSSAHNRHSLTKGRDSTGGNPTNNNNAASATATAASNALKDIDRAKLVRERQLEERQRKLEELRQQAIAAQKFREQREEERRRRIEELRTRDYDRRHQVEERKRQLWEAERDRRDAIMRKNQEREARMEAKRKNERSHIVFAFGSSTPRMLEPADTGGANFWGARRATSTTNIMSSSYSAASSAGAQQPLLTRRSSERELDGSKKRATSAGGLDRKPGEGDEVELAAVGALTPTSAAAGCVTRYANRRRTDLMPTIPSPREGRDLPASGRSSSAKSFTRSPGMRSGEVTPSSPSRPHSSMSQQSAASSAASSTVNLRPRTAGTPRRPRPASIAGTGVTSYSPIDSTSKSQKDSKPPLPKGHSTAANSTPPSATKKAAASSTPAKSTPTTLKSARSAKASPRATPRATPLQSPAVEQPPAELKLKEEKVESVEKLPTQESTVAESTPAAVVEPAKPVEAAPEAPVAVSQEQIVVEPAENLVDFVESQEQSVAVANAVVEQEQPAAVVAERKDDGKKSPELDSSKIEPGDLDDQCDMTASMIQKIRITTEEEAKAALAERRRLAREQAEREAELERQRLEEEERLEMERLRAEEEEQRRLEEETIRLAEEARKAEEQRLQQAIEEAKRREEEDRKRREEEAKLKLEKEEADRKAREEAEKQRLEMVERLKKEEEERNARRKRVEAIMSRTRAKNQASTPKGEGNDGEKSKEDSPSDETKSAPGEGQKSPQQDLMTASLISEATLQFISNEQNAHRSESNNLMNVDEPGLQQQEQQSNSNNALVQMSNGTHANGISDSSSAKPTTAADLIDNGEQQELNGHHTTMTTTTHGNGLVDGQTIALDNATVKQNNVTNNLLDLSEFDMLGNSNNTSPLLLMQPVNVNEDNINSNLNPTAIPFSPNFGSTDFGLPTVGPNDNLFHQDPFASNKQQDNQVTDLLS